MFGDCNSPRSICRLPVNPIAENGLQRPSETQQYSVACFRMIIQNRFHSNNSRPYMCYSIVTDSRNNLRIHSHGQSCKMHILYLNYHMATTIETTSAPITPAVEIAPEIKPLSIDSFSDDLPFPFPPFPLPPQLLPPLSPFPLPFPPSQSSSSSSNNPRMFCPEGAELTAVPLGGKVGRVNT